nr:hypothetical protein Itr_chr13CG15140 [Ipomoea trifida]
MLLPASPLRSAVAERNGGAGSTAILLRFLLRGELMAEGRQPTVAGKLHCCDSTQAVIPSWTPPGEGETTAATLQARRSTLLRRRGHGMKDVAAGVHHGRWKTGDDRGRSCYVLAGCSSLPPTICSVDVVAARRRRRITELTRCAAVASRRGKDRWALPLLSPAQFAIAARQRECRHPTPLPCTVGEQGRGTPLPLRKVSLLHASRRWKENVEPAGNTRTHRVALISPEPFRLELQPPVAHASFHRHCCLVSKVARKGGKGLLPCPVIPSWTPPGEGETTAATLQARRSTLLRRRGHGMKDVAAGVHHGRWKTGDDRGRSCYVLAGCSSLPPTICSVDVVAARRRRRITELTRCAAVASRRGKDRWALPLLSPAQFAIAARQRECRHPTPLPCTVGEQGRGTPLPLRKVSLLHASRRWKENVEPAGNTRTHRVALISPEPFRLELQPPVAHASFHRHCCLVSKVARKGGKGLLPCPRRKNRGERGTITAAAYERRTFASRCSLLEETRRLPLPLLAELTAAGEGKVTPGRA